MKNFRDELRLITNNTEWTDNEKFEAIDELHERYVAKKVKLFTIPVVSNCTTCNDEINYKGVCEMCYTELKLNDLD